MFGSQVNTASPAFQAVVRNLESHLIHNAGSNPTEAVEKAVSIIRAHVLTQSHATAMNDAFFLLGIATFAVSLSIILEMILTSFKRRKLRSA